MHVTEQVNGVQQNEIAMGELTMQVEYCMKSIIGMTSLGVDVAHLWIQCDTG